MHVIQERQIYVRRGAASFATLALAGAFACTGTRTVRGTRIRSASVAADAVRVHA